MGALFEFYAIFRNLLDYFVKLSFSIYFQSKKVKLPIPTNKILLESGVSLSKCIRTKKLTSEEVVQAFIDRIQEVNPILNAVIDERFKDAIKEARDVDVKLRSDEYTEEDFDKMPLLGVPFTTEESIACEGLSWTFGLTARKGMTAPVDADVIEIMKEAGAIVLGVTNVPQLNMWAETFNPVYGKTNNPYDTTRNVGGSSGGEASILAALGSPIGIGTDFAGSVRIPAFRCGLFGHKPTNDFIPTRGLTFRKGDEGTSMVTVGHMTKCAEDLLPLLKILTNNNPVLKLDEDVDVKEIKIFYTTSIQCVYNSPINKEMKNSVMKCANYFEELPTHTPKEHNFDGLKHWWKIWRYMCTKEKGNFPAQLTNNERQAYFSTELLNVMSTPNSKWCEQTLLKLRKELLETLGDDGVLILPPESFPVSYHYTSFLQPTNFGFYAIWNALKFPATQIPLGLNEEGVPLGVQVVATPNNDRLSIAVARELEKAFGGYVYPS